jgi:P4 family phage/plasmid primase-like protien
MDSLIVWKTEGPTDLLALVSLGLPEGHTARCNPFGAMENPLSRDCGGEGESKEWMLEELRGCIVYVVHDCDEPGQNGAMLYESLPGGRMRLGWAPAIAKYAKEVRNVVLPYPIEKSHGKDLRDWIWERMQAMAAECEVDVEDTRIAVYNELLAMAQKSDIVPNPDPDDSLEVAEDATGIEATETESATGGESSAVVLQPKASVDDFHRLAKINLEKYQTGFGRDLKHWNGYWYAYKNGRYEQKEEDYIRARLTATIKEEFDRQWFIDTEKYEEWKKSSKYDESRDKGPPEVRKVPISLVRNVADAMKSLCVVPSGVTLPCWLEDRSQPHLLAMRNGLLDLDALGQSSIDSDPGNLRLRFLRDLSSQWFSTFALDYEYDPEADCPEWKLYIKTAMEGDQERMDILQEWAGYLLTSTNDLQRFLCLEGDGGNGKTVYFAGIEAMLGADNVSHVPIENFGGRFDLGSTLGKVANICGDVGEVDQVAEGSLKQFTGGDSMFFDRKGVAPISARPTAKLMCAWNNRPRLKDRSSGLWRRMLLIPFNYTVPRKDRKLGMDSRHYWERNNEVAGILNWAVDGLIRLKAQEDFTRSSVVEDSMMEYRYESNLSVGFLEDHLTEVSDQRILLSHEIYQAYDQWARKLGLYPLGNVQFFRELNKKFPGVSKKRSSLPGRPWGYCGIKFLDSEIFEQETPKLASVDEDMSLLS